MRGTIERRTWTHTSPHRAAHGTTFSRSTLLVRIDSEGTTGWGEAAPLPSYDGGDIDECADALASSLGRLSDCHPDSPDQAIDGLGAGVPLQARAALDTALRDVAARRRGIPLWQFLGGSDERPVVTSRLLAGEDAATLRESAREAVDSGFTAVKMKIGQPLDRALDSVAAVDGELPDGTTLIVDANGSLAEDELRPALVALAELRVAVVEQPSPGMRWRTAVADMATPLVSLDEAACEPGALDERNGVGAVCLKLQSCGGLDRLQLAVSEARSAGLTVYLGSTLEGPIGVAASLHAAMVIRPDLPSGLATLDGFVETRDFGWTSAGLTSPPSGPGLGIDPDGRPA